MQYLTKARAALILMRGARNEATFTNGKIEIMVRGQKAYTFGRDAQTMLFCANRPQWYYFTYKEYLQALDKMKLIAFRRVPVFHFKEHAKRKTKQATFFLPVKN